MSSPQQEHPPITPIHYSHLTNEDLTKLINEQIIEAILNSPLNIESIPDDLEREIYRRIFTVVEAEIVHDIHTGKFCTPEGSICRWFKRLFSCKKAKKEEQQ